MSSRAQTLRDLVQARADTHPDALAVGSDDGGWLSFGALSAAADQLARRLLELGAGPGSTVGVLLPRSTDAVVAVLACWWIGAAYVPVDPAAPQPHRDFVVRDSAASVVVCADVQPPPGVHRCQVQPRTGRQGRVPRVNVTLRGTDPAWVLYTSGSTGRPKGVVGTHRACLNRCAWMWRTSPFTPGEVSVQNTGPTVVDSFWELWGSLAQGVPVLLPAPAAALDPDGLIDSLARHRVTRICLVPSLLRALLDTGRLGERLPLLCRWVSSGEPMDWALVDRFRRDLPGAVLLNQYGLTESCADVTVFDTGQPWTRTGPTVPIGRPIDGVRLHIMDADLRPVPAGASGELCLAGAAVALGYVNRPVLTAARFQPDAAGQTLLRTGDLVRQGQGGVIEHLGRLDRQVKIRGFRVEPEGVEAVLATHPGVSAAAVTTHPSGHPRDGAELAAHTGVELAAYVVPVDPGDPPSPRQLREHLAAQLPAHQIPATFTTLARFPLTATGKIDRAALPEPDRPGTGEPHRKAETPAQRQLVTLWQRLLGVDRVGVTDGFFELGGHSLLAVRMLAAVNAGHGTRLAVPAFLKRPTVEHLATLLDLADRTGPPSQASTEPRTPAAADPALVRPLSPTQRAMWLHEQWSATPGLYNIAMAFRLHGRLDLAALRAAANALVAAHPALRSTFDATSQRLAAHADCPMTVHELGGAKPAAVQRLLADVAHEPFDLTKAPALRVEVLRLGETEHVLCLSVHHLACDGRSIPVLLRGLSQAYGAALDGRAIELAGSLPPAPAGSGPNGLTSDATDGESLPVTALPTDRPRPATPSGRGATVTFAIGPRQNRRVHRRARQLGVTPFVLLCTALAVVLSDYTGQRRLAVAVPVADRLAPGSEDVVGCLMRTTALRLDLGGDPTVTQLLHQVREQAWLASFGEATDTAGTHAGPSVMLAYDDAHEDALRLTGVRTQPVEVPGRTTKLDLTLYLDQAPDRCHGRVEYATELFDEPTVTAFVRHLRTALEQLCDQDRERLSAISVLDDNERAQLLRNSDGPRRRDYPLQRCLHELIEQSVARNPQALAHCGPDQRTHAELIHDAGRVAAALRCMGFGAGDVIGVHLPRGLDLLVALLGVLKAGCAYLPLDPDQPPARLRDYVSDAGARLVITDGPPRHWSAATTLDQLRATPASGAAPAGGRPSRPHHPAYVIFTSGSTGRPKGVVVPHSALVNHLLWMQETFRLDANDCVLLKTSIGFDVSVWELFLPLLAGARVEVAAPGAQLDLAQLVHTIRAAEVSTVHVVPSMLALLLEQPGIAGCTSLRRIFAIGEALAPDLAVRTMGTLNAELHNLYGPTEAAVAATWWHCEPAALSSGPMRIGRPIANTQALVLDGRHRPVPVGVPGELCLGGVQLADGYAGRPALTAQRFVAHPSNPGQRVYRTGDLVRWRRDGNLEYLGRTDRQVKIAGVRVEPGEVEALLRTHPGVRDAVVQPDGAGLVAYVVPRGAAVAAGELRGHLRGRLPLAAIPAAVITIDRVPRLTNGKIDHSALRPPAGPAPVTTPDSIAGRLVHVAGAVPGAVTSERTETAVRELARQVWVAALRCAVPAELDFIAAGGDSFTAIRVVMELNRRLGATLSPHTLLQAPTFDGFVAELRRDLASPSGPEAVQPQQPPVSPTSPLQQRWFTLAPAGHGHIELFVQVDGPLRADLFAETVAALARRHAVLRSTYRDGDPPTQRPAPGWRPTAEVTDLQGQPPSQVRQTVADAVAASLKPFDLTSQVPFELRLLRLGPLRSLLIGRLHHIAVDGWSITLLVEEFERVYAELAAGRDPAQLPPAPQYASFAQAQRGWLAGADLRRAREHWRAMFDGCPGPTMLPRTALPRPGADPGCAGFVPVLLAAEQVEALRAFARRRGSTLFSVLVTAFACTLRAASGCDDVVFGTSTAGRHRPDSDRTLGVFVSPMPVRVRFSRDPSDLDRVHATVRQCLLDLNRFPDYPLGELVRQVAPFVGCDLNSAFSTHLVLQNYPAPATTGQRGYDVVDFQDRNRARPLDLPAPAGRLMREFELIAFEHDDGGLSLNFGYRQASFTQDQVRGWVNTYLDVLTHTARHPVVSGPTGEGAA